MFVGTKEEHGGLGTKSFSQNLRPFEKKGGRRREVRSSCKGDLEKGKKAKKRSNFHKGGVTEGRKGGGIGEERTKRQRKNEKGEGGEPREHIGFAGNPQKDGKPEIHRDEKVGGTHWEKGHQKINSHRGPKSGEEFPETKVKKKSAGRIEDKKS